MSHFSKYLENYAEPEVHLLPSFSQTPWNSVIAIPAKNESEWLPDFFHSLKQVLCKKHKCLVILVLNGDEEDAKRSIEKLALTSPSFEHAPLFLYNNPQFDLLLVNRTGHFSFPQKQGVGLARKIGCDIAAALYAKGSITSSFVHTPDADVLIPSGYLDLPKKQQTSAFLFPFVHQSIDNKSEPAHGLYETYLRYYVDGLKFARSPYAFQTVGSTFCISLTHYVQVRGFPRREAGEDFYLLNKLAKVGNVVSLESPTLTIRPRFSKRVPFGTGQSTNEIHNRKMQGLDYEMYDPEVFKTLRDWIHWGERFCESGNFLDSQASLEVVEEVFPDVKNALTQLRDSRHNKEDRKRTFHEWFDGFRTVKFINHLTRSRYPKLKWEKALHLAPFSEKK